MTIEHGNSNPTFDEKRDKTGKFTQGFVVPRTATGDGSDLTTSTDDFIIAADTSSSTLTVTLATATVEAGRVVIINDEGGNSNSNNITIDTEGSETIDGNATATLSTDNDSLRLYSDGTNWFSW